MADKAIRTCAKGARINNRKCYRTTLKAIILDGDIGGEISYDKIFPGGSRMPGFCEKRRLLLPFFV